MHSSFRGYQRIQENVTNGHGDFHEAIDFYSESDQAHRGGSLGSPTNYGKNQWPESPAGFKDHYALYVDEMRRFVIPVAFGTECLARHLHRRGWRWLLKSRCHDCDAGSEPK